MTCLSHHGHPGPLGNSYSLLENKGKNIAIVAAGFAVPMLRGTMDWLLYPDNRKDYGMIDLIYRARTPGMLLYKDEITAWQQRDDVRCHHISIDREAESWAGFFQDPAGCPCRRIRKPDNFG